MKPAIIFKDAVGHYRALNAQGRLVAWGKELATVVFRLEKLRYQHTIDPEMVEVLHKRFPNAIPV